MHAFSLRNVCGWLLVLNLFLMRPAALGQDFTNVAILLAGGAVLCKLLMQGRGAEKLSKGQVRRSLYIFSLLVFYYLYLFLIGGLSGAANYDLFVRELLSVFLVFLMYLIVLSDLKENALFFRRLSLVVAVIGWSGVVTAVLIPFVGLDSLHLFNVGVSGYQNTEDVEVAVGAVYFPFSMVYSTFSTDDFQFVRFNGFFREAGIYQAICCYCFVCEFFSRKSRFVLLGLVGGVLISLSTAGVAVFLITLGAVFLVRSKFTAQRFVMLLLVIAAAVPVVLYAPYVGILSKTETHSDSVSDRQEAVERGLSLVLENPMGLGLGGVKAKNASINLIAALGSIGVVGFVLQVIILSGIGGGGRAKLRVIAFLPLVLTALFSQPLIGAPAVYVLLLVCFDNRASKSTV